jgi:hypothetical protein
MTGLFMKIMPYFLVPGSRQNLTEQSAPKDLAGFNRLFNRILQQSCQTDGTEASSATKTNGSGLAGSQTALAKRMDNFFNLLEGFRAMMANPLTSLKELHPAAEKIESEINALALTLDSLPAKGELAKALKKALPAAAAEVTRFRDGSYLTLNARAAMGKRTGIA